MKTRLMLKYKFVTLLVVLLTGVIHGQTGIVQGVLSDYNGINVSGANIVIEQANKGTVSDANGRFTLVSVPTGKHLLKITYLGCEDIIETVQIEEGQTKVVNFTLQSETLELQTIDLTETISGEAKALNQQKSNMNITNVVSTDQIDKFPDVNIGDAVKRIPGITMQVDQGEARNIIVRGLSPQLNSVTLNGSRIPSAEGDNRNVQMDLIPSDMIQSIEVNKAVTPDMDADALGGSVNLITHTTPQNFRLSANLGTGVSTINDKPLVNGAFLIGDRSKNRKLGWLVSASLHRVDYGSDNVEAEWDNEFEYNTGVQDSEGEDSLEEVDVNAYTKEFQIRKYLVERVRRSVSANLDYEINENHNIYFKSMYNWRDDRENRFRVEYEMLDGEDIGADDFTITDGNLTRFPVEVKRQTKGGIDNNRNKNRRLEDQRMQNYTVGGDHILGNTKIDWMTSYAKASEERLNERYAEFESEYSVFNNNRDSKFPLFSPENIDDTGLKNFEYGEITEENRYTEEDDINMALNVKMNSNLFGNRDGFIKFGVKARLKSKLRDNDFYEYNLEDAYATLDQLPIDAYSNNDFIAGNKYVPGEFASAFWLGQLDLRDGELVPDEFLRANYDVKENVWGTYLMTQQYLNEKLSMLVGLRLEATQLEATGNSIEDEEEVIGKITEKSTYVNVLPGIHAKYRLSKGSILRFAWTNTLARPNYEDIVPTLDVVMSDEEIYEGNPDLNPTKSMNFDVMAEQYFDNVGILSGGVFYKRIKDFIYTYQSEISDNSYGIDTEGFRVFQPLNGDNAQVFGVEVALQRQLDFLPGFAKHFNVYLNYTYLNSSADGIRNEDGDVRDDIDLPNTTPHLFNASLGYKNKRFAARISANFTDAYVDEIGGKAFDDRYYDQQFFLDFNMNYVVNDRLRMFAQVNNITNQPLRYFQQTRNRTQQVEYTGQRVTLGLKYDLFKKNN